MSILDYDALNLADKDLQYGKAFLEQMQKQYHLPFISANVYHRGSDELFVKPYVIKQVGGLKIGIFGVAMPLFPEKMANLGFEIRDPTEAARRMVAELSKPCDVVIALSHLGLPSSKKLAAEVNGLDFVISGHHRSLSTKPDRIGETVVMQAGAQGKYLGHIEFEVTDGTVALTTGRTIPLSQKIRDDSKLRQLVKEYDDASTASAGTK